jgi:Rps23 Pro-64 3,4-dihydroxylase Tpa1-like proline 4-hydroxylase
MILDKKLLTERGYLTFNLKDLDEELYNHFKKIYTKEFLNKQIKHFRVDASVDITNGDLDIDEIINTKFDCRFECNTYIREDFPVREIKGKAHGKIKELKKVQNYINEFTTPPEFDKQGQEWYFGKLRVIDNYGNLNESAKILQQLYTDVVKNLYKDDIINSEDFNPHTTRHQEASIAEGTDVTMYIKNNYITTHADGLDKTRLCVMLMYLNDDWENGYGGEIVVNEEITIPPLFGNIVILDFTQNNIEHEVLKVVNESFERYAIIKFFHK